MLSSPARLRFTRPEPLPHLRCCVELSASALVVDVPCLGDPRFAEFARRIEDGIKELTRITRY